MASEWYYTKSGQRFGPVSGQQLKELATNGQLGQGDLVWQEGMAQWMPAKTVQGLFEVGSAAPAAIEPTPSVHPALLKAQELMEAIRETLVAKWRLSSPKQKTRVVVAGGAACLLFVLFCFSMFQGPSDPRPKQAAPEARPSIAQVDSQPKVRDSTPPPPSFMEEVKQQEEEEKKLIQQADNLWTSGRKHEAADIYQSILDKHGGLYHGKAASSRVYSRTIDSLVERGGPGAVQNYIRMATVARVSLVLSNPEARKLAGDAAAQEQGFLTTPPDTGGSEAGGSASADQIGRRNNAIASDLKSFTSEKDMRSTYGPPTAFHQSSIKKNACLIAWERTRQSGQKEFLAITFLRRLDGQDQVIIINADVVPSLDRLVGLLNSNAVWNP